jgi:phosphatidylcholine synthase
VSDRTRLWLAWGVHLFTASGALVGALALLAVHRGDLQGAALLMLLAMAIDSLDGGMARAVGVARLIPSFDGRRLDDMVDFLNYVIVPCVFLVAGGLLPHWTAAVPPILASAYGFSQVDAKTEDDFFLGFPSYWNVIAIYAWLLEVRPGLTAAIVAGFALLVFVPFKYAYPSKLRALRRTTWALTAAAAAAVAWAALEPERARALRVPEISLLYPAWYLGLSFWLGGLHRSRA